MPEIFSFSGYVPYFCTGFLALRKTPETLLLLKNWDYLNGKYDECNQVTFQKAVLASNVNGRVLPIRFFPSGNIYFEQMSRFFHDDVIVLHNNFIVGKNKKIHRFRYFQLWYAEQGKIRRANQVTWGVFTCSILANIVTILVSIVIMLTCIDIVLEKCVHLQV